MLNMKRIPAKKIDQRDMMCKRRMLGVIQSSRGKEYKSHSLM
jgi:hypothetical protein